ncbi:MAG: DUF4065 domain-containing protein [Acidimicrobiia bacterium]|nr:DUF4065 domain-containing protein [Acidimicrobiia bacterium]
MSVSAHDVAAELRRRFGDLGVVKLHKLLYYAQGCHLVWAGEPLFEERIEAWVNGPVVARLWRDEKHDHPRPAPAVLTGEQLATVDYVVDRYGQRSRAGAGPSTADPSRGPVARRQRERRPVPSRRPRDRSRRSPALVRTGRRAQRPAP